MNYPPVLTKADFVRRYKTGEFGNTSRTWDTCDALLAYGRKFDPTTPVPGLFHLRNRIAGGSTYYNLHWSGCVAKWCDQENSKDWYASEMAPHDHNLIQGELYRSERGVELFYSTKVGLPMRDALLCQPSQIHGIMVLMLLKHYMDNNSYEWTMELLDRYPDHTVEFSTFSKEWGTVPGYNTVYWEVRLY